MATRQKKILRRTGDESRAFRVIGPRIGNQSDH
jgi:hypothetical protein